MPDIKYIKSNEIDFIMWDRCISRSHNGNVFGYSWYLDSVCNTWDALVLGNYNAVMPLPVKKNFVFSKVSYPDFLNKTNIYQAKEFNIEITNDFIQKIPSNFRSVEIKTGNPNLINSEFKVQEQRAFKLDLISSYQTIKESYSDYFLEQLRISEKNKISYNTGILPNGLALLSTVVKVLNNKQADKIRLLSAVSLRRKLGEIYGAFNSKNRLAAAVLFISSHYKTYIIYAVQTKEAKKKKAIFGLIDYYIKTHSEKALTLDFSGLTFVTDDFFKGLGSKEYPQYLMKKKKVFPLSNIFNK
ncbi:MAG: hypothetical protein K8R54_03220 [Bacteroidales bacterium]|nr:hypothetical protein [Bacteroidales bacterium]